MPKHLGEMLNDEQYSAVTSQTGPVIVLAGPGTGKTRVIVHRVAHLIREYNVLPESIVALTFTNKAAGEMRSRLTELLDSTTISERVIASTFHSFGLRMIRQFADLAGLKPEPQLVDDAQQRALMRSIVDETRIGLERHVFDPHAIVPKATQFVNAARNIALFPNDAVAYAQKWHEKVIASQGTMPDEEWLADKTEQMIFAELSELYKQFDFQCLKRGWVTFNDLLAQPLSMLKNYDTIRAIVHTNIKYIVVDEFQDVNPIQIELLKHLCCDGNHLCVVGDDDQAIYGFRGSAPDGFKRIVDYWPQTQTIELVRNYRSTPTILAASDAIISKCNERFQPDKQLIAEGWKGDDDGPAIEAVRYGIADGCGGPGGGPGAVIGTMIRHEVENTNNQKLQDEDSNKRKWSDMAVIVRNIKLMHQIAASLESVGIPVELPELPDGLQHPVVLDVLSWLRILEDLNDHSHAGRLLIRPPYDINVSTLKDWQREHQRMVADAQYNEDENEANRPFVDWLIQTHRDHDQIRIFGSMFTHLRSFAENQSADAVVLEVITKTGLLTLDPVDSDAHRVRIEQLGRFLGFIRDRMICLDQPRKLKQLITYLDDMEQEVGANVFPSLTVEDRLSGGEVSFSDQDAVRILTAHRAKGLEFHTVFIPRINSPHGYPNKIRGKGDPPYIPEELHHSISEFSEDDEERRVFFVALTRAQNRAVILSQASQSNKRKCNPSVYWNDLKDASCLADADLVESEYNTANQFEMVIQDEDAIINELQKNESNTIIDAACLKVTEAGLGDSISIRQRERLKVRHGIYSILLRLADPTLPCDQYQMLGQKMLQLAYRLPILLAGDKEDTVNIIDALPLEMQHQLRDYASQIETLIPAHQMIPNPQPPLKLSYSKLNSYISCPRCYWLRHVVGLSEPAFEGANFGKIAHRALELFYKRYQRHHLEPDHNSLPTLETILKLGEEAYEDLRPETTQRSRKFVDRLHILLTRYYSQMHSSDANPVDIEKSIVFKHTCGEHEHTIEARIDRIDADDTGHHIIDYKTGRSSKSKLEPKTTDLQLGIYKMALQHYFETEDVSGTAEYWLLGECQMGIIDLDNIKLKNVRKNIDKAITGILNGDWTRKKGCTRCELLADPILMENLESGDTSWPLDASAENDAVEL